MKASQAAAELLKELALPSIGWGDSNLLHILAERLGMPHEGSLTERKVLNRIDRSNRGEFYKAYVGYPERGLSKTRRFTLHG